MEENRTLVSKHAFDFPILSDPGLRLARQLGMFHEKARPGTDAARPGTYVIDRQGRVRQLFTASQIRIRPDPEDVLAAAKAAR